jgi:DnaK suppressor protein
MREVDAALARMDDGSYGVCEETGDPIPFGRLSAEPTARFTVEAQEQLEHENDRDRTRDRDEPPEAY